MPRRHVRVEAEELLEDRAAARPRGCRARRRVTENRTCPFVAARARRVTVPPSGEYLTAFSIRFESTCRSWPGSAATAGSSAARRARASTFSGQMRLRRVDLELRDRARVAALDVRAELAGVELAREQEVADDLREPVRLLRDHLEQLRRELRARARRRRGEASARRRRSPRAACAARARPSRRSPAASSRARAPPSGRGTHRRCRPRTRPRRPRASSSRPPSSSGTLSARPPRRRRDRQLGSIASQPGRRRGAAAEHVVRGEPGDPLRGRVPEPDAAAAVDEHDAVADRGEHAGRLRARLGLAVQPRVLDRARRAARELLARRSARPRRSAGRDSAEMNVIAPSTRSRPLSGTHMYELEPELPIRSRCSSSRAPLASISAVISATSSGSPVRITAGGAGRRVGVGRIALLQLARERQLRGVGVRDRDLGERAVGLDDVHRAPVGDARPRELARPARASRGSRASARARRRRDDEARWSSISLRSWMSVAVPTQNRSSPSSSRIGTARPSASGTRRRLPRNRYSTSNASPSRASARAGSTAGRSSGCTTCCHAFGPASAGDMPVYSNQRRLKYVAPPCDVRRPDDLRHRVGELAVALLARALECGELLLVQLLRLLPAAARFFSHSSTKTETFERRIVGSIGLKM